MVQSSNFSLTSGLIVAVVEMASTFLPGLLAADVGMAVGASTGVAIEAADHVVQMKSNLENVRTAMDLADSLKLQMDTSWYNMQRIPAVAGALWNCGYGLLFLVSNCGYGC